MAHDKVSACESQALALTGCMSDYSTLVDALRACHSLLNRVGETQWSERIDRVLEDAPSPEVLDIGDILSWFGGMGSINDVVLCQDNGHLLSPSTESATNTELRGLLDTMFRSAMTIHRAKADASGQA